MDNENQDYSINNKQEHLDNLTQVVNAPSSHSNGAIKTVEKSSAWVLIFSAVLFALIAIMSIWGVFGSNSNVAWKSAASLGVIAVAALIVNLGARIYEGKLK
jgi:hypothetical protein